jgi:glycosyltransferase involved in cell wall biosynthesis
MAPTTDPRPSVGLIAAPLVPVPPPGYGGTELVVGLLADGLRAAGCDVVLFASGDSTAPVERRWLHPEAIGTMADPEDVRAHVERAYDVLTDVDVVHDHTEEGPAVAARSPRAGVVAATTHGRLDVVDRAPWRRAAAAGVSVVAISRSQARSAPDVPFAATIHHGIDVDSIPVGRGDGGYVLFLGRMCPDKGADRAIRAARAAGKRIVLAAKAWEPAEVAYLQDVVEPLLGPDAEFVGEVGPAEKFDLLGGAEALVNPIRWPEPFGLVMVESLACGTPVVGFPDGAAAELVEHGRTGLLGDDEAALARHLGAVGDLDRRACRTAASERFSVATMVEAHLDLYRRMLAEPRRAGALAARG